MRFLQIPTAFLLFVSFAFGCASQSQAALTESEQHLISCVDVVRMRSAIERLCADDFAGRRAGSQESYSAADYIASEFRECGLSTLNHAGIEGYKQPLTMKYSLVKCKDDIKAVLSYKTAGKNGPVEKTRSFAYTDYNGRGGVNLRSQVVFVGYGIHDPDAGYDNYAKLDVAGKIVMWLPGQPKGVKLTKPVSGAQKLLTAYQRGAAACLMYKPVDLKDGWRTNTGFSGQIADFPYIGIDKPIANELMSPPGTRRPADDFSRLPVGTKGTMLSLRVTPVCDPERKTFNVIGVLPGADPELAKQIVIVGAHYDHLGTSPQGDVFRGADDNASGTSVVLEIARAIQAAGFIPRRTIVFASWTGEEAGLVGSNYFTTHPPFPLTSISANIELDMVGDGTPNTFMTIGASAFPKHHEYISGSASDLGIELQADKILGASDHLAFMRKRVPTALIFSAGEHPHYHTIRDVPAAINSHVLESAAKLTVLSIWRAANL